MIQIQYSIYNYPIRPLRPIRPKPKTHKTLPRIGAQTPGCFLPGRQLGAANSNSAILASKLLTPGPKPLLWSVLKLGHLRKITFIPNPHLCV